MLSSYYMYTVLRNRKEEKNRPFDVVYPMRNSHARNKRPWETCDSLNEKYERPKGTMLVILENPHCSQRLAFSATVFGCRRLMDVDADQCRVKSGRDLSCTPCGI